MEKFVKNSAGPFDRLATPHTIPIQTCGPTMKHFEPRVVAASNTMRGPWSDLSERELVALTISGNGEAFAVICSKYEQQLFKTAYQITKNSSDAEDVVQEALLRAYKNIAAFRFASSLVSWLTRIVINCALMELRRRKTRPWLSLDHANEDGVSLMELVPDSTADAERAVCLEEQLQLLRTCIARLPPKLRTVIEDYRISEPTIAELAKTHAITVAAVKSRLLRAKKMMGRSRTIVKAAQPPRSPPD